MHRLTISERNENPSFLHLIDWQGSIKSNSNVHVLIFYTLMAFRYIRAIIFESSCSFATSNLIANMDIRIRGTEGTCPPTFPQIRKGATECMCSPLFECFLRPRLQMSKLFAKLFQSPQQFALRDFSLE